LAALNQLQKELQMKTISFDFDQTLFDEETHSFIETSIGLLRFHLDNGDDVIVTTSRIPIWAEEAKELLMLIGIDIPVFSAPDKIGDGGTTKSDVLVREKALIHFDDIVDADELIWAKENGVVVLLPPHMKGQ
jgi:hypothetical protein